jgi:hypothetical protein
MRLPSRVVAQALHAGSRVGPQDELPAIGKPHADGYLAGGVDGHRVRCEIVDSRAEERVSESEDAIRVRVRAGEQSEAGAARRGDVMITGRPWNRLQGPSVSATVAKAVPSPAKIPLTPVSVVAGERSARKATVPASFIVGPRGPMDANGPRVSAIVCRCPSLRRKTPWPPA